MNISKIKTLIPAPEDGEDGQTAASGLFIPAVIWVEADEDGWSVGDQSFNVTPSVMVEGIPCGFEDPLTIVSSPAAVTARYDGTLGIIVISVADGTDPVDYEGEVKVRMEAIVNGKIYPVTKGIPIVANKRGKQGEAGQDGVTYEIIPSVSSIRADADGNILTGTITVSAFKIEGKERTSCRLGMVFPVGSTGGAGAPYYWVQYRINGGAWTDCSNVSVGTGQHMQIAYGVPGSAVSNITSGIAFRLCYGTGSSSYSVVHETAALQVVRDGQTGQRGKTGRFYYYDGYFDSDKEYRATEHQAPYVAFDWTDSQTVDGAQVQVVRTSYYMLIAETNKPENTYIAPKTDAASSVWELMETSFKFLITEAVFSSFAKLGSAVFCGDWLLSQWGDIEDFDGASEQSNNYVLFDPTDIDEGYGSDETANELVQGVSGEQVLYDAIQLKKDKLYTLSAEWVSALLDDESEATIFLADSLNSPTPVSAKETPTASSTIPVRISVSGNWRSEKIRFVAPETGRYYVKADIDGEEEGDEVYVRCRLRRRRFIPRYFADLLEGFSGLTRLSPRSRIPGRAVRWNAVMTSGEDCTADGADLIVIPNRTGSQQDIWLEDPSARAGSVVSVVNRGTGRVTIRSAMPHGRSRAFKTDSTSGWGDAEYIRETDPLTDGSNAALAVARFWSDGEYWYKLEWRTKDGKSKGLDY